MKRLGFLMAAAILAGCSGAGSAPTDTNQPASVAAWPVGWQTDVCEARRYVNRARGHISDLLGYLNAYDVEGADEEAKAAAGDAQQAETYIAGLTAWAPGHSFVVYLGSAASAIRKASNLTRIVLGGDRSAGKELEAQISVGSRAVDRAATAQNALKTTYGLECFGS